MGVDVKGACGVNVLECLFEWDGECAVGGDEKCRYFLGEGDLDAALVGRGRGVGAVV
jgi:hypothetical protein